MNPTDPALIAFRQKVLGCFMGAAIGDAMGGPVECQHYRRIADVFPDFDGFLPYRKPPGLIDIQPGYALDAAPGSVTDDTFIRADLARFVLQTPPAFARWLRDHADFSNWWSVAVEVLKRIQQGELRAEDAGASHVQAAAGGGSPSPSSTPAIPRRPRR
jgi:ADP-ribosylglycohydrolase